MLVFALTVLAMAATDPPQSLEGRVVSMEGKPVRDATVSILGRPGSTRTDAEGRFTWQPAPTPPFEVLVVLLGGQYMAPVLVEELPEQGPVTIAVSPLVTESVTVTGGATPHIEAPPASGMSIVPRESIEERHPVRLAEVLENVPGAERVSDLHAGVPTLRGLARGRTLILIDGARVSTERRAGPSATYLDPFFLQGVEVSRGPGSVSYGSDAFGGVIHARTPRPDPDEPWRIRLQGAWGTGLPERRAGVQVSHGFGWGGALFQARVREFHAYRSPEGEVFDSQARDHGFLGRFSQELGSGQLSIGWQTDRGRDIGRPTTRSREIRTAYPYEDSHRFTAAYRLDPVAGFTRVDLEGFLGTYRLVTDRESLPTQTAPRSTSRSDVDANDFGVRVLAVRPFGPVRMDVGLDINGRFGLEARNSFLEHDLEDRLVMMEESTAIENARRADAGAYVTAEALWGSRLMAAGGLRFDHVTTKNEGGVFDEGTTSHRALSGHGALTIEITRGFRLTGQVSRGFRDPTLSDRYFFGVSGRGVVTGNPFLDPERSLQFDVALRWVRDRVRWALYLYHYRIEDLIERFEDGGDRFFFRNRGQGRIRGIELEIQGEISRGLSLEIAASGARGETRGDGAPLDDIPAESVSLELRKSVGPKGYAQLRLALYGRDEAPGPTEMVTPGYATVRLSGGWHLSPQVELRVVGRNLFNRSYPVSADDRAVLAPGRSALVNLVASF